MNWWLRDLCSQFLRRWQKVVKAVDFTLFFEKWIEEKKLFLTKYDITISSDNMKYLNEKVDELILDIKNKNIDKENIRNVLRKIINDYKVNKQKYI